MVKPAGHFLVYLQPFRSERMLPEQARSRFEETLERLAAVVQVVVQAAASPTGLVFIRMTEPASCYLQTSSNLTVEKAIC